MSQCKDRIEHEVEQTLAAFCRADRLSASPWFGSRVRARLAAEPAAPAPVSLFAWRRLRPALLALIVLLNLVTAVVAFQRSEQTAETRLTYVSRFASEYAFTPSDMLFNLDE